jgi:hypothetical protein
MWRCAVWQSRMSEGKESSPSARPTLTTYHHTPGDCTLFQLYYRYCLMLALFLLWYLYVCPWSSNTVACFYLFVHSVLRYFYYQHMSLYIFFTPLNYASSLPNTSTVNAQFVFQFICQLLIYRNLMRPLRNYKMYRIPCDKLTVYSKNDHCKCGHLPGGSSSVFR